MRQLLNRYCLLLSSLACAGLLTIGCGTGTTLTAPDVPGEQLTNPEPGSDVPGDFIPYLPPPGDNQQSDPIPAPPDPGLGLTSDNGQGTEGSGLGDPVYNPSEDGLDLVLDVQVPTDGSLQIDIDAGGNDPRTHIIISQDGGSVDPVFTNDSGITYDARSGKLTIALVPGLEGLNVYLDFTVLNGNGEATNESHGIVLPPGWTPLDTGGSGSTREF